MHLRRAHAPSTAGREADEGFALITTVLTMALLAALSLVVLQQTITGTAAARKDQDWVSALGAAQAGLDDYLSRLNDSNGAYYVHDTGSPDPANPAMGTTAAGQPRWAPVPTAAGEPARGSFHYDVDTTSFTGEGGAPQNGNIVVESTGRVGTRTRTLTASVRRSGFVDYVYFTDLETQDPLEYPVNASAPQLTRAQASTECVSYYGTRNSACTSIAFSNDVVRGPVHSNDTMLICNNVTFHDTVTTKSAPVDANGGKAYRTDACGSTSGAVFERPDDPKTVEQLNLPSTNTGLKFETSAAAVPRGCLYVGPTKIVIRGSEIRVTSPWTKDVTPGCAVGTFFPIPVNGVVYVDAVPSTGPNSWGASEAGRPPCPTTGENRNNVGYPIAGEASWEYPCTVGDAFVEQLDGATANALSGRMTVAANNNLYVTNHLDYAAGATASGGAFLGLIAEQFLYVWHPINGSNQNLNLPGQSTAFRDARISAALLSVNHSFTVQHNRYGSGLGTLHVTGAITQKFRGIVRRGSSGYAKNYVYDQRLRYDAPPRFLNPTLSSFGAVRIAEDQPRYR